MADEKQTFLLDLDAKEFLERALQARGAIQSIGDSENLAGLLSSLKGVGIALGAVGVVALGLKASFEAAFETERIEKINNLFDALSKQAGISSDVLKNQLAKSVRGLADDTDVLEAANKALVTMGGSAERLGEVMGLARRLTTNFGGDLIERFNQLTFAISSGSTRMLKANGIMIDADKAMKEYAKSLGVSTSALTQAGRQQAILNAVLAYGEKNIKDTGKGAESATASWKQFKVALGEVGEAITVAVGTVALPYVKQLTIALRDLAVRFKETFGEGATEAKTKVAALGLAIKETEEKIRSMERNKDIFFSAKDIEIAKAKLEDLKRALKEEQEFAAEIERKKAAQTAASAAAEKEARAKGRESGPDLYDPQKKYADELKFQQDILRMKEEHNRRSIELAQNETELEKLQEEERYLAFQEWQLKKQQLEMDLATGKITSRQQLNEMLLLEDQLYYDRLREIEAQSEAQHERMEENKLRASQNTFDGIGRAAEVTAARATRDLNNFGKQGMMVMDTLKRRGADAFEAFGRAAVDHSQSASQIMKGFFLNSLADIAQAQGQLYLAAGLVDPTKLAAGAALLALSGALRAMAGSAGGGGDSFGSYGGAGGGYGGGASSQMEPAKEEPKKSVTLNIMGHYMESDQTKTWLMDQIRSATDATDFKYVQIGQT